MTTNNNPANRHPCFSRSCAAVNARLHVPVAPKCNIQCNYCRRRFDCANESRPGVTSSILSPQEALARFIEAKKIMPNLSVVGIAGPGDALANPGETFETLRLIREIDSDVLFCVSTNGLLLSEYAETLRNLGVSHITVTMNTLDAETGKRIYRFADYHGERFMREDAAALLLKNQIEGIQKAVGLGMMCKINTVMLKGLNDGEIPQIVEKARELGASISNIMQLIPVKGSLFQALPLTSAEEINALRKRCEHILPQMYHCQQCRADAFGTIGQDMTHRFIGCGAAEKTAQPAEPPASRGVFKFAVSSRDGTVVDVHFGHADVFYIYEYQNGTVTLKEKRGVEHFCAGDERCVNRQDMLGGIARSFADCSGIITMRIGYAPERELSERGIRVFTAYDYAENAVREAAKKIKGEFNHA